MPITDDRSAFESAKNACSRLNVSPQTLYAYVSRGLVRSAYDPNDSRKRLYASVDINLLLDRQMRGRSRQAVARSTIDFGEPVLRSSVSSISDGQFFYRGQNAVELSKTASLEDVFELLCSASVSIAASKSINKPVYVSNYRSSLSRFVDALAYQTAIGGPQGNKQHAYQLLTLMTANAAGQLAPTHGQAIHKQLANAWSVDSSAADLIRRALVLCADHELNASTYAARVTASAGASLPACLLSGISTLSGQYHGGLTQLCVAWMRAASKQTLSQVMLLGRQTPPGFGHRLYPNGDPRAIELLRCCSAPKSWSRVAQKIAKELSELPTLDYGLAALEHQLNLPKGAGFSIFAVGRSVGWLAHCFEQRKHGALIRPRATV